MAMIQKIVKDEKTAPPGLGREYHIKRNGAVKFLQESGKLFRFLAITKHIVMLHFIIQRLSVDVEQAGCF